MERYQTKLNTNALLAAAVFVVFALAACNAFMTGLTQDKAQDRYLLVTGNPDNFGDKRLRYNKGFRRGNLLCFIDTKGDPGFIYEYRTSSKCNGIRLYYPAVDSVFVFEEPEKGKILLDWKESRRMDALEQQVYERLKAARP